MTLDRATVVSALRVDDVLAHFSIPGQWRGRWLRSQRCAVADDHAAGSMPFGIAHDGKWHCWACDQGGDILRLIAVGEKLDLRSDFPRILEIAAKIAGVEDDESFGGSGERPAPKARAALPPIPPLHERIALAKRRAAWVWDRLMKWDEVARTTQWGQPGRHTVADAYLALERRLDPVALRKLEELREMPMRITPQEAMRSADMKSLAYTFTIPGVALPVRAVDDGRLVDVRVRRFEPRDGQPKIIGMLGGVTVGGAEAGKNRTLVGCYGHPECIDPGPSLLVVIVEGALDYLTALNVWPEAQVLGAVDAGSMSLVAGHAARQLASYPGARLLIVEQNDGAGAAADRSVNEDPNAATKVAVRILGPKRVGWLFCEDDGGGSPVKDLNDLHARRGAEITRNHVRWWSDMEQVA